MIRLREFNDCITSQRFLGLILVLCSTFLYQKQKSIHNEKERLCIEYEQEQIRISNEQEQIRIENEKERIRMEHEDILQQQISFQQKLYILGLTLGN